MGPGGSRSAPPGEHGEAVGFAWSMEADPVGPCAVCTQACYSRGPNGRQRRAPGAGLLPARWRSASAQCLGVEAVVDRLIDLGDRPALGARSEGADLVHAILAGADCIDDTEVHGGIGTESTAAVLGHRVMAASTIGTFPRVHRRPRTPTIASWQTTAG